MDISPFANLLIVVLLILANGFFVATEFALVSSRSTRIDQLASAGSRAARLVKRAKEDPTRFISGTQLGVTVASLLLGWIGEEAVATPLDGLLGRVLPETGAAVTAHGIASVLAIVCITFFQVTLGEQVPKIVALENAERLILLAAPPVDLLSRVFRPFIALLYQFTKLILRLLRVELHSDQNTVHSPEELQLLVTRSAGAGLMSPREQELVTRAFAFRGLNADEVMVPRTEVVALSADASVQEAVRLALRDRHSRYPVYEGTIDNVIGILSVKDLLAVVARRPGRSADLGPSFTLRRLTRPPIIVPRSANASEVVARMKTARQPLAVLLDEYGGTAGIVTLRDLVARLVGDVGDEYTEAEQDLRPLPDGSYVVDGLALVDDVNARLGTRFDASEVDTVGGLVFSRLDRRPMIGDEVEVGSGYRARVDGLDGLRVARVRLSPLSAAAHEPAPAA